MEFNNRDIQLQYEGFLNTSLLWNDSFYGLHQLLLPQMAIAKFEGNLTENPRLGKRVESFVSHYLQRFENINVLQENIQIQYNKITIGELDCILLKDSTPIHLEIIYKFYLYDHTIGHSEIDHWIGPNRNDSLQQKVEKLRVKQLPLLFRDETKDFLDIDFSAVQQKVLFKAQLFVPYANQNVVFEQLNSSCVCGFYIKKHELSQFSNCKFFIPTKINWLVEPHKDVDWLSFHDFKEKTSQLLLLKKSPLCWMKQPNGELYKFFLVWFI